MQYITDLSCFCKDGRTAVTLGKFDGLHRGHQRLIDKINEYAQYGAKSVVFAFDMHRQSLLTSEERREHLEHQVDYLIECPFTEEIRNMEAEDFIRKILVEKLHVSHLVVGTDFHFGHGKRGNVQMLSDYAKVYDYRIDIIEKERHGDRVISSTYVKEAMADGDIELANALLGYRYSMTGMVEYGKQLGRRLGFPTMNVPPPDSKILPRHGVYACMVHVNGGVYHGIGNVGCKPTVVDARRVLTEVYVFDYEQDAYGQEITVEYCAFVRPEEKFASVEELKEQVEKDILFGRQYFSKGNGDDKWA